MKHPFNHALNLFRYILGAVLQLIGDLDVAIIIDILTISVDLLQHFLRLDERKWYMSIFCIKQLVGNNAHRPHIHLLVVAILRVYLRRIVTKGSHLRCRTVHRSCRNTQISNHTPSIFTHQDVLQLYVPVDDES